MLLKNLFHLINMFLKDFFLELISVFLLKKFGIQNLFLAIKKKTPQN